MKGVESLCEHFVDSELWPLQDLLSSPLLLSALARCMSTVANMPTTNTAIISNFIDEIIRIIPLILRFVCQPHSIEYKHQI